jgi:Holliday junction resolvase RusA-like endonuclease
MTKVTIEVSGAPIAKARPRAAKTKTNKVYMYTPSRTKDFEYKIRQRAEQAFKKPMQGPVSLTIIFLLPRPKTIYWKTKPMPMVPCTKQPDIDNLVKSVTDSLNGVAFLDDNQVSVLHSYKRYHAGEDGPKTTIIIEEDELGKDDGNETKKRKAV